MSPQPPAQPDPTGIEPLLTDLRGILAQARAQVAVAVQGELVWAYWQIGRRIREDVLHEARAPYGQAIIVALAARLSEEYGAGFSRANLAHMVRFAEVVPDAEIVYALRRELSWTHLRQLIYIEDPLKRSFYMELCRLERWSTRTLAAKIDGMLYERTAISKQPEAVVHAEIDRLRREDQVSPDLIFRDPYVLDFLGLPRDFSEADLEQAILRELERFLVELGDGFCFVARQKRISVGPDDFYLDLLFFHRRLKCLVAVELKLGRFMPADVGQMLLYLRWLDQRERLPDEAPPIGLILCAEKDQERVEVLKLDETGIRVATYLTELPPPEVFAARLHQAVAAARARLAERGAEAPHPTQAAGPEAPR